jgi:hypothetical protein
MGDQLVVIGWGATVYGGDATDVLQMATVDYIPNEVCKNITGDVNGVPTSMESQVIDVTLRQSILPMAKMHAKAILVDPF